MLAFINQFFGLILRYISQIVLRLNPTLKRNFLLIERTILNSRKPISDEFYTLINAIILIEDKRFYLHKGIDMYSILRASIKNIFFKRLEGASTLTQQLVRLITEERQITFKRKIRELLLSTLIESKFSKKEIISTYLVSYKFPNAIGIQNLCKIENYNYKALEFSDSIEIAARFKYPKINSNNYIKYLKRVRTIEIKLRPTLINKKIAEDSSKMIFLTTT